MIPWPAIIMLVFAVIAGVALIWLVLIEYAAAVAMTREDWDMLIRKEEERNGVDIL
jgi:hypothetical protein